MLRNFSPKFSCKFPSLRGSSSSKQLLGENFFISGGTASSESALSPFVREAVEYVTTEDRKVAAGQKNERLGVAHATKELLGMKHWTETFNKYEFKPIIDRLENSNLCTLDNFKSCHSAEKFRYVDAYNYVHEFIDKSFRKDLQRANYRNGVTDADDFKVVCHLFAAGCVGLDEHFCKTFGCHPKCVWCDCEVSCHDLSADASYLERHAKCYWSCHNCNIARGRMQEHKFRFICDVQRALRKSKSGNKRFAKIHVNNSTWTPLSIWDMIVKYKILLPTRFRIIHYLARGIYNKDYDLNLYQHSRERDNQLKNHPTRALRTIKLPKGEAPVQSTSLFESKGETIRLPQVDYSELSNKNLTENDVITQADCIRGFCLKHQAKYGTYRLDNALTRLNPSFHPEWFPVGTIDNRQQRYANAEWLLFAHMQILRLFPQCEFCDSNMSSIYDKNGFFMNVASIDRLNNCKGEHLTDNIHSVCLFCNLFRRSWWSPKEFRVVAQALRQLNLHRARYHPSSRALDLKVSLEIDWKPNSFRDRIMNTPQLKNILPTPTLLRSCVKEKKFPASSFRIPGQARPLVLKKSVFYPTTESQKKNHNIVHKKNLDKIDSETNLTKREVQARRQQERWNNLSEKAKTKIRTKNNENFRTRYANDPVFRARILKSKAKYRAKMKKIKTAQKK